MVMSMSRPQKHEKTGVYQLRRRVPLDLVDLVGKREIKRSLGTKDRNEAAIRHAKALADLDEEWRLLRDGPKEFTADTAAALANDVAERWITRYRDTPLNQVYWRTDLADQVPLVDLGVDAKGYLEPGAWLTRHAEGEWIPPTPYDLGNHTLLDPEITPGRRMLLLVMKTAAIATKRNNWKLDDGARLRVVQAVASGFQDASLHLRRFVQSRDYSDPLASWHSEAPSLNTNEHISKSLPSESAPKSTTKRNPPPKPAPSDIVLPFDVILELWKRERDPKPKTVYEYERHLTKFAKFLSHSDASLVKDIDVIGWKDQLLEDGLSWKTIQGSCLAAISTMFQAAVGARRLQSNPARGVSGRQKAKRSNRRGFNDEEARRILAAAASQTDPVLKFIPLLCAYSGARVAEASQLRKQDVFNEDGIWCMRFTEEAGSVKTEASERRVPLHDAILKTDFLHFVGQQKEGPLFTTIKVDKFGSRRTNGSKIISRFIRGLDINDPSVAPSHSWRHRFKSLGREHGLRQDVEGAIIGHAPQSVGDSYGAFSLRAMKGEIDKIPSVNL